MGQEKFAEPDSGGWNKQAWIPQMLVTGLKGDPQLAQLCPFHKHSFWRKGLCWLTLMGRVRTSMAAEPLVHPGADRQCGAEGSAADCGVGLLCP